MGVRSGWARACRQARRARSFGSARRITPLAAIFAVGACADAGAPGSGGAAALPTRSLEAEVRIDGHEHELVPVNWLAVSANGDVAVAQAQDRTVRIFDSSGQSAATVGGPGGGPGEFGSPVLSGGWTGDTIWVYDLISARITHFSRAGELLGTVTIARPVGFAGEGGELAFGNLTPYAVHPDGTMTTSLQTPTGAGAETWRDRIAIGLCC